jgi:dolichol-phosphate mannosyltransferase
MNLSIVIPSFKESENLEIILPRLIKSLSILNIEYEILIIDSPISNDDTPEVCNKYDVNYKLRENGISYGDAIRTGIQSAKGERLLIMDADGSHDPDFVRVLWKFHGDYDVVIASRYVQGGSTENSKILNLMSWILNITYRIVLQINCKDISNSFKIYKTRQLKELNLSCNDFDIVEEILFKLNKRSKISFKEVPYTFKRRITGTSKRNLILFIFKYVITLAKLRLMK